jgi:hypothetical protein
MTRASCEGLRWTRVERKDSLPSPAGRPRPPPELASSGIPHVVTVGSTAPPDPRLLGSRDPRVRARWHAACVARGQRGGPLWRGPAGPGDAARGVTPRPHARITRSPIPTPKTEEGAPLALLREPLESARRSVSKSSWASHYESKRRDRRSLPIAGRAGRWTRRTTRGPSHVFLGGDEAGRRP